MSWSIPVRATREFRRTKKKSTITFRIVTSSPTFPSLGQFDGKRSYETDFAIGFAEILDVKKKAQKDFVFLSGAKRKDVFA